MAYIDRPRQNYRLRDRIDGKLTTIIRNCGNAALAKRAVADFEDALAAGFTFTPPIKLVDIQAFLESKRTGIPTAVNSKRLPIAEMCKIILEKHGPSLKPGKSTNYHTNYQNYESRLRVISRAWAGKFSDEINELDVRDLLLPMKTNGTVIRYLGTATHLFKTFRQWNERSILPFKVALPPENPATLWRSQMKRSQKVEGVRKRVLSVEEWNHFSRHLPKRGFEICDIALRRFLRPSDIKKISHLDIQDGFIAGLQAKTGQPFSVPVLGRRQPRQYDFTNFYREFKEAQKASGMDYPVGHPLRFSVRDLRRTGATWAYRKTRDIQGIREMLGHTSDAMTMRYLNIENADKVAIARAVDEIFQTEKRGAPVEQKKVLGPKA